VWLSLKRRGREIRPMGELADVCGLSEIWGQEGAPEETRWELGGGRRGWQGIKREITEEKGLLDKHKVLVPTAEGTLQKPGWEAVMGPGKRKKRGGGNNVREGSPVPLGRATKT